MLKIALFVEERAIFIIFFAKKFVCIEIFCTFAPRFHNFRLWGRLRHICGRRLTWPIPPWGNT